MIEKKKIVLSGLSGYQIKMIAVMAMTLDHLAAYGFEIPLLGTYYYKLRLIGRIAMPLFLFILTDSIRYTRNRPKLLLRLYLAAVGTGLFTAVTNYFFGYTVGHFVMSNIFYTYLYTAAYVILLEAIMNAVKCKNWKKALLAAAGIAATVIPHFLWQFLLFGVDLSALGLTLDQNMLVRDLIESFITSPWNVEYTLLFVLMGVMMYFARNKYGKAAVLIGFAMLCFFGNGILLGNTPLGNWINLKTPFHTVMSALQSHMILAVPIMLLYNGKKGRSDKLFFYLYYPLHRYGISVAAYLYLLFFAG